MPAQYHSSPVTPTSFLADRDSVFPNLLLVACRWLLQPDLHAHFEAGRWGLQETQPFGGLSKHPA